MTATAPATSEVNATNVVDLFAAFATDRSAERKGVDTPLAGCGDTLFRIARANSPAYGKALGDQFKRHKMILSAQNEASKTKSDQIMATVMADHILLGWTGTVNIKGVPTPYSREAAYELLLLDGFRNLVSEVADNMELYKAVKDEADAKN